MKKIEEAAEAANLAIGGLPWAECTDYDKQELLAMARAARDCLREPNDAMKHKGSLADWFTFKHSETKVFQAMLDATEEDDDC